MKIVDRQPIRASIIVSILFGMFSLVIYNFYAEFRQKEFIKILKQNAISHERLLADTAVFSPQILKHIEEKTKTQMSNETSGIYDTTGKAIFTSVSIPALDKKIVKYVLRFKSLDTEAGIYDKTYFLYEIPETNQKVILMSSAIDDFGYAKQDRLRDLLLIGTAIATAILIIVMRFFVKKDVKPIGQIADRMEQITAHELNQRLPQANLTDEVGQMARTFNDLLNRLEFAYSQQRNFVSYVTHELRTPLTIMQGQTEVTLMKNRSDEEYRESLESVKGEVQGMIKLVNELLELVRANADAHLVDMNPVRVDDLLWQARGQLLQKNQQYAIEIGFDELPDSEELTVSGNAALLKMAFMNLMENACKYSNIPQVNVFIHAQKKEVEIRFVDSGFGISEKDLEHIFEPFYRSVTTKEVSGHGIGLPLTKRIIEIHLGKISIESVVGKGSSITLVFPAIS
jgi:signal transduction histidine kinase